VSFHADDALQYDSGLNLVNLFLSSMKSWLLPLPWFRNEHRFHPGEPMISRTGLFYFPISLWGEQYLKNGGAESALSWRIFDSSDCAS
jgi:hypothetical protein